MWRLSPMVKLTFDGIFHFSTTIQQGAKIVQSGRHSMWSDESWVTGCTVEKNRTVATTDFVLGLWVCIYFIREIRIGFPLTVGPPDLKLSVIGSLCFVSVHQEHTQTKHSTTSLVSYGTSSVWTIIIQYCIVCTLFGCIPFEKTSFE